MKNVRTAVGGPYMIVVPESMIVLKFETTVLPPAEMLAPLACQKPVELATVWYSIEPLYRLVLVPPKKSSEPVEASLKPKTPEETVPWLIKVLKKGFCARESIKKQLYPP